MYISELQSESDPCRIFYDPGMYAWEEVPQDW